MDPVQTTAPTTTSGSFRDHVASVDAGADSVVPDHSPQISDAPEQTTPPTEGAAPELETPQEGEPEVLGEADELEALRKWKAELEGDALPEALRDKTMPVKIDGRIYDVPVAELAQGYQRAADYSRKLREVTQIREQAQQIQQGSKNLLQDLTGSGESLLKAAQHLGFYKTLVDAARIIGKQRLALQQLPPEAQQYALQLEDERLAREATERRMRDYEEQLQRVQQQQPSEDAVRIRHQLDQLVPRAFAKHKLGDYPLARDLFKSNLENLYEGDVTPEVVDAAAQATAEQLADIASRLPQGKPANSNGALPPRRAAPAAAKPVQNGRKQGGTFSDFRAHLDRLDGNR